MNTYHLEICEFANLSDRDHDGSNKSVFGDVVDETIDSRAESHLGHDLTRAWGFYRATRYRGKGRVRFIRVL